MEFSDSEQILLTGIRNDDLADSLTRIRRAMMAIWASDAPRIIQNYTDHGERHCTRVADYGIQLLQANSDPARRLSEYETYLLLAGIYLHDIGMQCDVARFPAIRKKAEEFGARFRVDFTAKLSSGYSIEEQKAIRENHHYLSAAWIDCAYLGTIFSEPLTQAVKSIPRDLVKDLIDICQYHSQLAIDLCPSEFSFPPTGRKRLVAALLRLSDELDIGANRVNIDTIRLFSLEPGNLLYWWLHNVTKVTFPVANVIKLTIELHPQDKHDVGDIVHAAFINRFQKKNESVFGVLRENGFHFEFSSESGVLPNKYQERLPKEIQAELRSIAGKYVPISTPTPKILLIEDSGGWRKTLALLLGDFGYEVEPLAEYSDAVGALLRAGARSAETEIALCISDLSLEGTPDSTWEGKGVIALCQVLHIPAIVVSENLEQEPDLRTKYGLVEAFDKFGFPEQRFMEVVQGVLSLRAQSMNDKPEISGQRQSEMLTRGLFALVDVVVNFYQRAFENTISSVEHSVSLGMRASPSSSTVQLWQKQIRELNQQSTSIFERMRRVNTFDELNALHPKVLNECLAWVTPG